LTAAPGSWWNGAWPYRKALTIDYTNVDGDLTDFPVLIELTDAEVATNAQSSGDDIVFTDINGGTLSHEIEFYNDVAGHIIAWVNVPSVSSTEDTVLFMYFGNSEATNQEDPEGTWGSNYLMVQHLDETTGIHFDSTRNDNDGRAEMGTNQDVQGSIYGADGFDGLDNYVNCGNDTSLDITGSMTVEAWAVSDGGTGPNRILAKDMTGVPGKFILWRNPQGDLAFIVADSGDTWYRAQGNNVTNGVWMHVVGVYDADNQQVRLYQDGVQVVAVPGPLSSASNTETVTIGASDNNEHNWNGIIDEVRISDVARSAEWIQTSYTNQNDPESFIMTDSLETACEGNFDCDVDCDGTDAANFKEDFGRSSLGNPCETADPCNGDFDCDNDCDGSDAFTFKADFGRSSFGNPCPVCVVGDWCTYP
jgi:MSHA biogenesis protein MshQ